MQDWPEQSKTLIHDPWFSIWKSPKETMREILDVDPNRHVLVLSAVAGIVEAFDWATDNNLGDSYSLFVVLLICFASGPIVGLVFVHLVAWLLRKTGNWLGGKASFIETRSAIAWSSVPIIWTLLFWIPAIAIFGNKLFQNVDIDLQSDFLLIPPLIIVAIAAVVIGIWFLFVFFNCLGEAHRFSAWKALAATIIGLLIVTVGIVIVAIPYALLI